MVDLLAFLRAPQVSRTATGEEAQSAPGRRWPLLLLLFAINLLNYIDRYVLPGVLPLVEDAFPGVTKTDLGMLAPAFLVVYMIASPVFGLLGDRIRRFTLVGIGVQLWSLATAAAGLARSFTQLFITRMLVGVGEASYVATAPTSISDLYPVSSRGKMLSFFYVAIPVGSALGYLVGGSVGVAWGWRTAFYLVGLPGLLVGFACYFMPEPVRGGTEEVAPDQLERYLKRKIGVGDYLGLLRVRSFLINTLGMTAYTYAVGGISYWMPTYLHQERLIPLEQATFRFGLVTVVAGIAGTLLGGALGDRLAKRLPGAYFMVSRVGMLLAFPAFYVGLTHPSPAVYWAAIAVAEFFLFLNTGPSNTVLVNVTMPRIRTAAVAFNVLIIHALGDVLSPVIMGRIADKSSLSDAFLSTTGVVLLSGFIWLAGTPFLGRDTAGVTERMKELG